MADQQASRSCVTMKVTLRAAPGSGFDELWAGTYMGLLAEPDSSSADLELGPYAKAGLSI